MKKFKSLFYFDNLYFDEMNKETKTIPSNFNYVKGCEWVFTFYPLCWHSAILETLNAEGKWLKYSRPFHKRAFCHGTLYVDFVRFKKKQKVASYTFKHSLKLHTPRDLSSWKTIRIVRTSRGYDSVLWTFDSQQMINLLDEVTREISKYLVLDVQKLILDYFW